MQDYISDPRNKLKVDRIKLALTHLEACDILQKYNLVPVIYYPVYN